MQVMIELREALMHELGKLRGREMNDAILNAVDRITHSIKSIDTILAMQESSESREGYSGRRYRDGYSNEGTSGRRYHDGYSGEYPGEQSGDDVSGRRGYFYTQRDDSASNSRRRDSMGRYADEEYSGRYSRDEAKDKMVAGLEGMMNSVSPETQRAIEKAIRAIERE